MRKFIYTLVLVLILNSAFLIQNSKAQWLHCNGPYSGTVRALASNANITIAGTYSSVSPLGVYISINNSTTWTQTLLGKNTSSIVIKGDSIFAGTLGQGIYFSTNNGVNWTQTALNNKFVKNPLSQEISNSVV